MSSACYHTKQNKDISMVFLWKGDGQSLIELFMVSIFQVSHLEEA